jgi:hypothetical protein
MSTYEENRPRIVREYGGVILIGGIALVGIGFAI